MILALTITYIWAGLGFASMIKSLRPILPVKVKASNLQLCAMITIMWPVLVFVFMFHGGDNPADSGSSK